MHLDAFRVFEGTIAPPAVHYNFTTTVFKMYNSLYKSTHIFFLKKSQVNEVMNTTM